jgi:hypothetical protein
MLNGNFFVVIIAYVVVETVRRIRKEQRLSVLENRVLRKTLHSERDVAREESRKPQRSAE